MNSTIQWYNGHASEYVQKTKHIDLSRLYDPFIRSISPPGARILDIGCGSGRDSAVFKDKGFNVTSIDASYEMVKEAKKLFDINVKCMDVLDMEYKDKFHAIWANASLLHLTKPELEDALELMLKALKNDGVIFMSFKYGTGESNIEGRHYTFFDDHTIDDLLQKFPSLKVVYKSKDYGLNYNSDEQYFMNILLRRVMSGKKMNKETLRGAGFKERFSTHGSSWEHPASGIFFFDTPTEEQFWKKIEEHYAREAEERFRSKFRQKVYTVLSDIGIYL